MPWPANLRLVSTLSSQPEFDLTREFRDRLAAIPPSGEPFPSLAEPLTLELDAWHQGGGEADELARLQAAMREDGLSESVAESRAQRIRETWPGEYFAGAGPS